MHADMLKLPRRRKANSSAKPAPPAASARGRRAAQPGRNQAASELRTVLVMAATAATAKVGAACVALLADAGHQVVTMMPDGRKPPGPAGGPGSMSDHIARLPAACCDDAVLAHAIDALPAAFSGIDAIVGIGCLPASAGLLLGPGASCADLALHAGMDEASRLIQATRAVLPRLMASGRGRVVQVMMMAHAGPACADQLSCGLRAELAELGIGYTRIASGPVGPAANTGSAGLERIRQELSPRGGALLPQDVAQAVAWALGQPRHVMVDELRLMHAQQGRPELSPRELEVLEWTACGKTSDEISSILNLSVSAVNFHVRNLMAKLQSCNKTSAVARAALLGMLA